MPFSADRRAGQPSELERLLASAEELAGLGSWALELRTGAIMWSDGMYRIYGYEPGAVEPSTDLAVELAHPVDRARVATALQMIEHDPAAIPEGGIAAEYRIVRPDGATRVLRISGRVERNERGEPARWIGSAQDITEQRLTERELFAHHAVSQALRDWQTFDEGVMGLLRRLAEALEFPVGALWTLGPEGRLISRAFWTAPGFDAGDFEITTRRTTFRPGEGVPGRVWQSREILASADLAENLTLARREAAFAAGLRTGLAFPATVEDETVAVLSFYQADRIPLDDQLLQTLTAIGRQLGRFLSRRRGDLEERRLSDRELEVLRLAAEGNTGPEIAERLVVSRATVKTHFENIYEKLGVGDRAAAVAHALRTGLIQ